MLIFSQSNRVILKYDSYLNRCKFFLYKPKTLSSEDLEFFNDFKDLILFNCSPHNINDEMNV
jgi:hypothetical protein